MSEELTKDYDIYNENGSVNLSKLKKLTGVDVPRALAEINTFAPKYAGQLSIYQRKCLADKLLAVRPDFKVGRKKDYTIAQAIVDEVVKNPARCRANHISVEMYKICKVIAEKKIHPSHIVAIVTDDDGNDVVISLGDFEHPIMVFNKTTSDEVEVDVVDEPSEATKNDDNNEKENNTMKKTTNKTNATTEATTFVKGDSIYIQLVDKVVLATIVKITKTKVIVSYDVDGEEKEYSFTIKAMEKYVAMQDELEERFNEQEEEEEELEDDDDSEDDEDEDEEDEDDEDETDWDEVLEGVSANNLKAMCKKLKVPMSEIKGRSKSDLISIILDYDDEEIEAVYNAVGTTGKKATTKDSDKPKKDEGKKSNGKYWENETPIESITEGNIVDYYEEAGKLQLFGRYEKNGEFHKTKGVTIDVGVMSSKDAMQMLSMMCYAMKDAIEDNRIKELVEKMEFINQEYNTEQYLFSDASELDVYDEATLKKMATNCGCSAKLIKTANKKQLIKLIIDATQKLNG